MKVSALVVNVAYMRRRWEGEMQQTNQFVSRGCKGHIVDSAQVVRLVLVVNVADMVTTERRTRPIRQYRTDVPLRGRLFFKDLHVEGFGTCR